MPHLVVTFISPLFFLSTVLLVCDCNTVLKIVLQYESGYWRTQIFTLPHREKNENATGGVAYFKTVWGEDCSDGHQEDV